MLASAIPRSNTSSGWREVRPSRCCRLQRVAQGFRRELLKVRRGGAGPPPTGKITDLFNGGPEGPPPGRGFPGGGAEGWDVAVFPWGLFNPLTAPPPNHGGV